MTCGNVFSGLVQDLPRVLVGFQLGQGQPQLGGGRAALDGAGQQDARVFRLLQLDGKLPKPDGIRNLLQSFPEDSLLSFGLGFQVGSFDPESEINEVVG